MKKVAIDTHIYTHRYTHIYICINNEPNDNKSQGVVLKNLKK